MTDLSRPSSVPLVCNLAIQIRPEFASLLCLVNNVFSDLSPGLLYPHHCLNKFIKEPISSGSLALPRSEFSLDVSREAKRFEFLCAVRVICPKQRI